MSQSRHLLLKELTVRGPFQMKQCYLQNAKELLIPKHAFLVLGGVVWVKFPAETISS